jgi:hypothetical protein
MVVVTQPQYAQPIVVRTAIPDNMGLAIFACLCCFWPLGLFAIFRANESQNANARGDIQGATKSGRDARTFSLISIALGIIIIIVVSVAIPLSARNAYQNRYNSNYYN